METLIQLLCELLGFLAVNDVEKQKSVLLKSFQVPCNIALKFVLPNMERCSTLDFMLTR